MGKSDEVADMSLMMCNDNGGQPYIYIVRNGRKITGGKNWQEKLAGQMPGKNGGKKNGSFRTCIGSLKKPHIASLKIIFSKNHRR